MFWHANETSEACSLDSRDHSHVVIVGNGVGGGGKGSDSTNIGMKDDYSK
jgi:hypothetical protein